MWGDKEAFQLVLSLEPTLEPTPSWQAEKICPKAWDFPNPPRFSQKAAPFGYKPPILTGKCHSNTYKTEVSRLYFDCVIGHLDEKDDDCFSFS